MAEEQKDMELLTHDFLLEVTFNYSAGEMASRFFNEIKENKKLYGVKCPKCSRVWTPPRLICRECYVEMDDWVEVGPKGTLIGCTAPQHAHPNPLTGTTREVPFGFGAVQLDGAYNNLTYVLDEPDYTKLKPGMRVEAIFADERIGDYVDILHFKVLGEEDPEQITQKVTHFSDDCPETIVTQNLKIQYNYTVGQTLSEFFTTLRDEGKLMGKTCPDCDGVLFPPRHSCGRCFSQTTDWVDISGKGEVTSFTVVRYKELTLPEDPPYILAQIDLDGTIGGITHLIKGVEPEEMKIGMKVKAVIKEDREGTLKDIECFRPDI